MGDLVTVREIKVNKRSVAHDVDRGKLFQPKKELLLSICGPESSRLQRMICLQKVIIANTDQDNTLFSGEGENGVSWGRGAGGNS